MSRTSASASPGPSTMAFLTMYNQHDAPKPFKRVPAYSTSASGRKRNYKQIIALEQEAAFELGGAAGGAAGGKRRKGGKLGAGGKKEAGVMSADGRLLQGAAAKQARRREDRLKKEAEQAAREEAGEDVSGTATPTGELTAGGSGDGDESMAEGEGDATTITPTEEELEQQRLEEEERKRKRSLPTYLSVEAPPSLRPAKKYCDVTGLIAPYTDPKTSLRYHSAEIYEVIKTFGPGIDQAYLSLRGRGSTLL